MKTVKHENESHKGLKIGTYSLLAFGFLATSGEALSQINHVDVDPDVLVSGGFWTYGIYDIDLNDDGTDDVRLYGYQYAISHSSSWTFFDYLSAFALNTNVGIAGTGGFWPEALNPVYGQSIGSSMLFNDDGILRQSGDGNFVPGTGDGYIGYRIMEADGYHYGWIRVEVTDPTSLYLKDYVYNETPDQAVLAGKFCDTPINLSSTTSTATTVSWDPALHADAYTLFGRKVGEPGFEKLTTTTASAVLPPLTNGTYEWTLRSICEGGTYKSQLAPPASFTIGPAPKPSGELKRDHDRLKTE